MILQFYALFNTAKKVCATIAPAGDRPSSRDPKARMSKADSAAANATDEHWNNKPALRIGIYLHGLCRSNDIWTRFARKYKWKVGRGDGQVVSVLTVFSNDPSSDPAEAYSFICNTVLEKNKNRTNQKPALAHVPVRHWQLCLIDHRSPLIICYIVQRKQSEPESSKSKGVCRSLSLVQQWPII